MKNRPTFNFYEASGLISPSLFRKEAAVILGCILTTVLLLLAFDELKHIPPEHAPKLSLMLTYFLSMVPAAIGMVRFVWAHDHHEQFWTLFRLRYFSRGFDDIFSATVIGKEWISPFGKRGIAIAVNSRLFSDYVMLEFDDNTRRLYLADNLSSSTKLADPDHSISPVTDDVVPASTA